MHKLGVIVPYRNREEQLRTFVRSITAYLKQQGLDFEIIVAEQMDENPFNRGALLNAGAREAIDRGCDYLVFHDVDLIPRYVDYSYNDVPLELVGRVADRSFEKGFFVNYKDKGAQKSDYFGGAVLFPVEMFEKINGFSNKYEGWGFEDVDLLDRCREACIPLRCKSYRQYVTLEPAFTFVEKQVEERSVATVKLPIPGLDLNRPFSILVSFRVDKLFFSEKRVADESCIFSIPGYDCNLSYTNYGTYKFEVFDDVGSCYSIHTDPLPVGISSQALITFKNSVVTFYLNGVNYGSRVCKEGCRFRAFSDCVYLGISSPNRASVKRKQLIGQVGEFAVFRKFFTQIEAAKLFSEGFLGLGNYSPLYWYSAKVLDGAFIPNLGTVREETGCLVGKVCVEPFNSTYDTYRQLVPWNRGGTFECQPHVDNGSKDGSWCSWETRINQRRYVDVETLGTVKRYDGLSTIDTTLKTKVQKENGYVKVCVFFKKFLKKNK